LELLRKEDWWAIWIGLGLTLVALALFTNGGSIKWLAVAPQKWAHVAEVGSQLAANGLRYAVLALVWGALFGLGAAALGIGFGAFLPSFLLIYGVALALYFLGLWDQAAHYNLEPPLVALGLGLLISNSVGTPAWLKPALRVEFYIKTGIVLLGASLPMTLIVWAGPVAIAQAAIVSLVTFGVIYFSATRLGLDRRLAATLGTGGAVCGVSGAIAIGGAVGAKKEDVSVAISLVVVWAWIGTSEFADAAGLAAAQTYGGYAGNVPGIAGHGEAAVTAFTLMKVIGRDVWIGVWAFVLSLIATTRWERTGVQGRTDVGEIWRRFPKFVLGFLLASAAVTLVARGYDYAAYRKLVLPGLVAPLQVLRTWAFTLAFLCIGLTTRLREFGSVGPRPLYAFTMGVVVNVALGFFLSTRVFVDFWTALAQ
jgi:uncharacterized membrane protein YadS